MIKEELEDDDHDESLQHTLRNNPERPKNRNNRISQIKIIGSSRNNTAPRHEDEVRSLDQRKASINSNRSNNISIKSESQRMIDDLYNKS